MNSLEYNFVALGHAILTDEPIDHILVKYELLEKLTKAEIKKIETDEMLKMLMLGVDCKEIARKYNLPLKTVCARLRRAGGGI